MWFKIKVSRDILLNTGKEKNITEYYLSDCDNFAQAGYNVMKYLNGRCEIEDVMLMKQIKPLANKKYSEQNKVFIVKLAEDFANDDGTIKTIKYPVPFLANNTIDLQKILKLYLAQGFDNMRICTISETKWKIV